MFPKMKNRLKKTFNPKNKRPYKDTDFPKQRIDIEPYLPGDEHRDVAWKQDFEEWIKNPKNKKQYDKQED